MNYPWLLVKFRQLGYSGLFGKEYRPRAADADHPDEQGIKWLEKFKKAYPHFHSNLLKKIKFFFYEIIKIQNAYV